MNHIDEFKETFTQKANEALQELTTKVKRINTFDIVANIFLYNSIQNPFKYEDCREDRNFHIPEVLSILALKEGFVSNSELDVYEFNQEILNIQELLSTYCNSKSFLNYSLENQDDVIQNISRQVTRHEYTIRNPGHPSHHFQFCKEMFTPIDHLVKQSFGFSVVESVKLREKLGDFLNDRLQTELEKIKSEVTLCVNEISEYKKTGNIKTDSIFDLDVMNEFCKRNSEENKEFIFGHLFSKMSFKLGNVISFEAKDLASYAEVELESVIKFLDTFSNDFPSVSRETEIFAPVSILKSKPILRHNGRYLVPSVPLLTFCVVRFIEKNLSINKLLSKRYSDIRHDFVLNKGLSYFSKILPSATVLPPNLFYGPNGGPPETDGIIIWDRILMIIEAKAVRISDKAKIGGLQMKKHIKDIVRKSYEQAQRTYDYILESKNAKFETKKGEKFEININDFDDVVFVSLNLESIGSWAMQIKATNEIGYFKSNHFPLIISLYDLVIFADMINNPILFFDYIKRRKQFLSEPRFDVFEELDLLGHYMEGGLNIYSLKRMMDSDDFTHLTMDITTDKFNDYYMQLEGRGVGYASKPKIEINPDLNNLLLRLDELKVPHRLKIALILLEFNNESHEKLFKMIKNAKEMFSMDGKMHNCSVYSNDNSVGITFLVSNSVFKLEKGLFNHCETKMKKQNASTWIGIGDSSVNSERYDIRTTFIAHKGDIKRISI